MLYNRAFSYKKGWEGFPSRKRCLETSDRKYMKTICKMNPSVYEINLLRQVGELVAEC